MEMGFGTLVLPRRELVRSGWIGRKLFDYALKEIEDVSFGDQMDILVYGKPFVEDLLENPKIHFASLSWFLRAKVGEVYTEDGLRSLQNNILYKCTCSFCRGRRWNELIGDIESVALHNLAQINKVHKNR